MKKTYAFLLFLLFAAASCKQKTQSEILRDNAITSVQAYLHKNLNDPDSYQALSFGKLKVEQDAVIGGFNYKGVGYTIHHTYRAKNGFDALIKYDQKFILGEKLEVAEVRDLPE